MPKDRGISYFICPMDAPGVSMQPIADMTTAHSFNQVFFDDVRLSASLRVGAEGDGWRLAKVTLANERVGLSSGGVIPKSMQSGATEVNFPRGGLFPDVDPIWHYGLLFSPPLTLGGGTFAVQRNIVAEHVLGLPRDPDVEAALTWAEAQRRRA